LYLKVRDTNSVTFCYLMFLFCSIFLAGCATGGSSGSSSVPSPPPSGPAPGSEFLYFENSDANGAGYAGGSIGVVSLNPASGTLSNFQDAINDPTDDFGPLNIDPDQTVIFSSAGSKYIYAAGTGAVNSIPPSPGAGKSGIFGFTINGTAGQLTPISGYGLFDPQIPFGGPTGMTIDGSGKYLYFSDQVAYSNYLREFTIGAGGVLQEGPIISITSAVNWNVQAADPTGKYVYAWYDYANGNIALSAFAINASTGTLTEITGSPFLVATGSSSWPFGSNDLQFVGGSITFSPSGKFLYASVVNYPFIGNSTLVTNNYIYTFAIAPVTGALGPVPGSPVYLPNVDADQLVMHPSGKFLYASPQTGVANNPGILMFPIDATSGAIPATPISAGAGNSYYRQVLIDPSGNVLVGRGTTMDSFTINSSTGLLTAAGSLTATSGPIPPTPTPAPLNFGSSVIAIIVGLRIT
jgi:hypothetical protein